MTARTETVLADGRQLVYFDDVDRHRVPVPDLRRLTDRPAQGQLRVDPLTGHHVTIAAHRQGRLLLPATPDCPLCPGQEVPDPAYDVAVFENRWPSFIGPADGRPDAASGRCEVVAFTDRHDARVADLSPQRTRTVMDALADRTAVLGAYPEVVSVACFENRGESTGVTLHHPHGQIYGYPFVPPIITAIAQRAQRDPGLFDRVVAEESAGDRLIARNDHWICYVPEAASWPYEAIVMPRRHVPSLTDLSEAERDAAAALLPPLLCSFDRLFDLPVPYIAGWRQNPSHTHDVRVHLRVTSAQRAAEKLKYLAGSESAYGAFINDVSPEAAAGALRRSFG